MIARQNQLKEKRAAMAIFRALKGKTRVYSGNASGRKQLGRTCCHGLGHNDPRKPDVAYAAHQNESNWDRRCAWSIVLRKCFTWLVHKREESPDLMDLYKYMEYNDTLQHFIMTGTAIDLDAATALVEFLRANKSLTKLWLWGNRIGPKGALAIIRGLAHNHSLQELRMVSNEVGSEAAKAMADVLMTNASLTTLDFRSNQITDEGGKPLVAALKINVTCRFLDIEGNPLSDKVKEELNYNVSLNNAGRQLLRHHVPKGLWAILLSRNNLQKCKPDVIYYMLLAKPELVMIRSFVSNV
jgi:Ran GTPase-activating protein (RanGAP) involved in mRNA processing and transport